jgi:DNA-binding transcriptional ArsR family regulator
VNPSDQVWKALSDPTRRQIIDRLALGPRTTGELCAQFAPEERGSLARTTVMKHLDVLVAAHLVLIRREGRTRWNYINPAPLQRILDQWLSRTTQASARALNQLAARAAETKS